MLYCCYGIDDTPLVYLSLNQLEHIRGHFVRELCAVNKRSCAVINLETLIAEIPSIIEF